MTDDEIQKAGELFGAYYGDVHHMHRASLRDFVRHIERMTLERALQEVRHDKTAPQLFDDIRRLMGPR